MRQSNLFETYFDEAIKTFQCHLCKRTLVKTKIYYAGQIRTGSKAKPTCRSCVFVINELIKKGKFGKFKLQDGIPYKALNRKPLNKQCVVCFEMGDEDAEYVFFESVDDFVRKAWICDECKS